MGGIVALTYYRLITKQQISASTTTAKATNAVGATTQVVYVFNGASTGVAYVVFGPTGGAATAGTGFPIAAGMGQHLRIGPGEFVHVILSTGTGTVDVCEMGL